MARFPEAKTSEVWRISTQADAANNDSDKTFTVPAGKEWQVLGVYVSLTSTADAGNRQMTVQALDASDNVIADIRAGAVQAASLTRIYQFGMVGQDTAFRDTNYLGVSMPILYLSAGQKLRVYDKAAIAAGADDMVVRVQIASRDV